MNANEMTAVKFTPTGVDEQANIMLGLHSKHTQHTVIHREKGHIEIS